MIFRSSVNTHRHFNKLS